MNGLETEREALTRTARRLAERGHVVAVGGNLSLRVRVKPPKQDPALAILGAAVPGLAGAMFLATRSGARLETLDAGRDLVLVHVLPDGDRIEVWSDVDAPPTIEIDSHLAIHAALVARRIDSLVVAHAHPRAVVALTHVDELRGEAAFNRALRGAHPESAVHLAPGLGWVDYRLSGRPAIARLSAEAVVRGRLGAVWDRHGVIVHGRTPLEVADRIDLLDFAAGVRLSALATGRPVTGLSDDQVDEARAAYA